MTKTILTFGLISGVILSLLMTANVGIIDEIGFDSGLIVGYTSIVLAFLLIFFGIRAYRDNVAGGTVGFGRAFTVGALIALVASTCYVATWQVVSRTFASDFTEKYAAYTIEKARTSGVSAAELEQKRREIAEFQDKYRNPLYNIAVTYLEPLPVGLVIALVSAAILSRRRREGRVTAGGSALVT